MLVEKGDNLNPFNKREKAYKLETKKMETNQQEKNEPEEVDTIKKNPLKRKLFSWEIWLLANRVLLEGLIKVNSMILT